MTSEIFDRVTDYDPLTFEPLQFHTSTSDFVEGKDTARDYLERCLHTIGEREPDVQAWVVVNEAGARTQADQSTRRWREGKPLSPIDGLPIGIKDLLETRDMPTEMGCVAYRGNFPKRDNAAVWALRQAGAVIVGKTVTTEFGGPEPSKTKNPFNPTHTPGGSSSGSGAAVGAQMVPATIATQTGGSLMRPASFNGAWGIKPSQGSVNRGERQTASMTGHGVIAGGVDDMWLIIKEIASRTGGDPGWPALTGPRTTPHPHKPFSLAILETDGWQRLHPRVRDAFDRIVDQVESHGVIVVRRSRDWALEQFEQALAGATDFTNAITAWEHFWALKDIAADTPDKLSRRGTKFFIEVAEDLGAEGYERALRDREAVRTFYSTLMRRVDAVLAPTTTGSAPLWLGDTPGEPLAKWPTGDPVFNIPSSLLGAPAVSVPMLAVDGLPMGLQIMGQQGSDARMTAIARWLSGTIPASRVRTT